ncbi:hypothetical protein M9H77_29648 [Catharanthus roseus]|uniref:Uncharacterized protein n=1 Tax=Catharanthus roseus TaxID=4058 RepID=A0ACB9ZVY8_CATRO|nr:hypothetical protein M9H77_29648 [Catharanthus roseus]
MTDFLKRTLQSVFYKKRSFLPISKTCILDTLLEVRKLSKGKQEVLERRNHELLGQVRDATDRVNIAEDNLSKAKKRDLIKKHKPKKPPLVCDFCKMIKHVWHRCCRRIRDLKQERKLLHKCLVQRRCQDVMDLD